MEYMEFKAKTVEEAVTAASIEFGVTSSEIDYQIVDKGSTGFLGLGAKPAVIKAKKIEAQEAVEQTTASAPATAEAKAEKKVSDGKIVEKTEAYLAELFKAMDIETQVEIEFDEENNNMNINLEGPEMGILIGKRGQTLDALQYLISLFVNKESDSYIRLKLDTENYRARRKDTLENLAKNIAFKVKRSRRSITLEPMNPYERRIIHSALQNDKYVATRSEGEEPYRKVVVYLKK
ncbi:MAG: RNA-binding cell elongation regulator Jag/EloR [Eubacteriales bacterium]|nr:RNA-binding cell elongation regulator Jag/EloR [Eubacteriales bacterium]